MVGNEFYGPYLHAARKALLPGQKNRINEEWTFEDVNKIVVEAVGGIMAAGGFLIVLNRKTLGPMLLILAVLFMIATQDNWLLKEYIKPAPKAKNYRWNDLCRHVSIIGASLLIMTTDAQEEEEGEDDGKEKEE